MSDKPTILLIDDNAAVVEIVKSLLERGRYRVKAITSSDDVFRCLQKYEIDLVVSDVRMPGLNGFELSRKLRADPVSADIPIIFLTALNSMEDEFEGYLAGADAYITKPFRARDLLAAVNQVLNRRSSSGSSGRLSVFQDVARVLAVVGEPLQRTVGAAMRHAGFELTLEESLSRALARIDRERFHLLICETGRGHEAIDQVREFLSHFALATPVIFLYPRDETPVLPLNDPQFKSLRTPATPAAMADMAKRAVRDFGGAP